MANPNVDLGSLTVQRDLPEIRAPRRLFSRLFLPLGLVLGFAGLFAYASWDVIAPATPVTVVPVVVRVGTVTVEGGELFKANGWVEPRPLAIDVPVQTDGLYRVAEVLTVAGDHVKAGQLLVRLDGERAGLDLQSAQRRLDKLKAAVQAANADLGRAEVAARNARAAINLAKDEGSADVAAATAEMSRNDALVKAAELTVKVEEELRRTGVINSDVRVLQARQQREVALADRVSANARLDKSRTLAAVRSRQAELAAAAADADLVSLRAKADEAGQEAAGAEVDVRKAKLELDRTRLVAPVDGVVLQLNVRVGSLMGGKSTAVEHKDAAVTLYDPAMLQVRVEVPVGKFGHVRPGQPVVIEFEDLLPGVRLPGAVLGDAHLANVARNSVPVRVSLPEPPPAALRPDMISSVRFLAPKGNEPTSPQTTQRPIVPRRLLRLDGNAATVWVVEPGNRAAIRSVELAPGERDRTGDMVEVLTGLNPGDKLIASGTDGLTPGRRVRITGDEQ